MAIYKMKETIVSAFQWQPNMMLVSGTDSHGVRYNEDKTYTLVNSKFGSVPIVPGSWILTSPKDERMTLSNLQFTSTFDPVPEPTEQVVTTQVKNTKKKKG